MNKLVKAIAEVKQMAIEQDLISVHVDFWDTPTVHVSDVVFDELKASYGWETSIVPFSGEYNGDKEFIILGGVEVFTLRERAKEAV